MKGRKILFESVFILATNKRFPRHLAFNAGALYFVRIIVLFLPGWRRGPVVHASAGGFKGKTQQ
jgi:hypothetical protein